MRALTTTGARGRHAWPAWLRMLCPLMVGCAVIMVFSTAGGGAPRDEQAPLPPQQTLPARLAGKPGDAIPGVRSGKTLALHDSGASGELHGIQAANLVSHQSAFELRTVDEYRQGDLETFSAIVYIGHDASALLPDTFMADVRSAHKPMTWFGYGVERLLADPGYGAASGWRPDGRDERRIIGVHYKGVRLDRNMRAGAPVGVHVVEPSKTEVLAEVVHDDGSRTPWAVRSRQLTYVGGTDRYLAAADLILPKAQAPRPPRALVRLEDVGPATDPGQLRAVADYLHGRGVPFEIAVWARDQFTVAPDELTSAGPPAFPHCTASAADYQAAMDIFGVRYDRGSYFAGWCQDGCGRTTPAAAVEMAAQTFPFVVRDVYGAVVVPENLGYLASWTDTAGLDRDIDAVLSAARALRVVGDRVAGFFYHPGLGVGSLGLLVNGIQAAGYRFVPLIAVESG